MEIPHFVETGRVDPVTKADRMAEAVYSQALDYLVFGCVDLVFTFQTQVFLAKRRTFPRPDWWIVGGRMIAGESPLDTAQRKAAEEAHLTNLHGTRYRCIGVYSTCFAKRQQLPQHHGSHSLNITYQVELTPPEKTALWLREEEYITWQWVDLQEAIGLLKAEDGLDPALLKILHDLEP